MQRAALQQRLYNWHLANAEFANAACARSLSLRHWDQDDPYEMLGPHIFLPGAWVAVLGGWCITVRGGTHTTVCSV